MKTKKLSVSAVNGITFTLSNSNVDRAGDRVKQNWDLKDFLNNPVALFGHDHHKIIGVWENVKVIGGQLQADLKLAKKGTSALVDEVHALVEQGILKAVSVGFSSAKAIENSFGGYDLDQNSLFEASLVAVPAHQDALRKSLSAVLSSEELDGICTVSGCSRSKSLEDNNSVTAKTSNPTPTIKKEFKMKTLAQRIKELQELLLVKKDAVKVIAENEKATDEEMEIMLGHTAEIENLEKKLSQFEQAEKAIATTVVDNTKNIPVALNHKADREKGDFATKLFVSIAKAHVAGVSPAEMAAETYGSDKEVMDFVKAATNPARTDVAGWAEELVETGYGEFLETLYPATVYGRVAGKPLYFGKYGSLIIPSFAAGSDVSGEFIAEGAAIPVKAGAFTSKTLTPKKLGVIVTFTREILTKSTPAVESLVRNAIVQDTAMSIDKAFLGNAAASATQPAGLLNPAATGAANIVASTGATVTEILADIKGIFGRLSAVQLGQKGVWLMTPMTKLGLETKQLANGQFAFAEVRSGSLAGHPIVTSTNVPDETVYFVDDTALVKGSDIAPEFTTSNQATLVMADPAEAIGDGSKVTALPVRSLYQTDTVGLRFILGLDWAIIRQGGVQALKTVKW